jgi:hypothetical protein
MGFIKDDLSGMGSPFVCLFVFFNLVDSAQKWLDLAQPWKLFSTSRHRVLPHWRS